MALSISSTNLIDLGSLGIEEYPFTLLGWFRVPSSSGLLALMRIINSATGTYHGLNFEGHSANQAAAISKSPFTSAARSTIPMNPGQWHQVTGVFVSPTVRRVYLDGGNQNEASHDRPFGGSDTYSLGNLSTGTPIDAAEVAVLDVALQENDIQRLATGISPLVVSDLQNVLCYHNCVRRLNYPGLGPIATSVGATVASAHPRVFVPRGSRTVLQPCRFAGPYALRQEALQTDGAEHGQIYISGIEANGGEAYAA